MLLAIEMDDRDMSKYGKIHKAGCRDLRDPEPIGEASDRDAATILADDVTYWGHEFDEPYVYNFAPCSGL